MLDTGSLILSFNKKYIGKFKNTMNFSFYINDYEWSSKSLLENKALMKTILETLQSCFLDVVCVRLS